MGYIVMAYARDGYQEFLLPELDDADYDILLEKQNFGFSRDLTVTMEIIDGVWKFRSSEQYRIFADDGTDGTQKALEDGIILEMKGENFSVTLVGIVTGNSFRVFQKYILRGVNQITVGKEADNSIVYDFRGFISRSHAVIYRYNGQWVVQDNSSNGTYQNGKRVQGQQYIKFGDQITLFGLRMIFLEEYLAVCALTGEYQVNDQRLIRYQPEEKELPERKEPENVQKQYFKRSPRTIEKLYTETIEIEAPPELNKAQKRPMLLTIGPSLTMAIPMMLGCLMAVMSARSTGQNTGTYMFTGLITAAASAAIGVLWALVNLRYSRQEEEENEEIRYNAYGQYLIDVTEFIKEKYAQNQNALFRTYLSGQECCGFKKYDMRLWNHNERQKDFMSVRVGIGTIPFQAEIKIPKEKFSLAKDDLADKPNMIRKNYQDLYSVPVCMDIRTKGLIGLVGGEQKKGAYEIACNLIAQLAANICYTDVKMVFIYRGCRENRERFHFAKWLPHVWSEDKKTRLIAEDKEAVGDIFFELSGVIRQRTEEQQKRKDYPLPHYVIFVEEPELIEGELLENYIYHPKPEFGITTFFLAEKYGQLPNSCEYIIQNDGTASQIFHVFHEEENSRDLKIETVSEEQLEALAKRICGVEVSETAGSGEIPEKLEFLQMYGVDTLEELKVLERWKKNRTYETMRVPIGQKNGGSLCNLDIHEKYHGPHGLIAGTTGSGKSETLQTYMLSLAVHFSPDDIAFFVIDFKGGGMANLFSGLPHMAGQISNLSGNQVRRAMISIKSENQRRQRIFAEHSVNNINSYTRLYKNHEAKTAVPHLFIIIDEFAELKREEPEFMKELISVAQVGRSLGVHLILATQKPSGTVDDNIWSNSKFRLCLRVQDKQDSNDMLHKPDAAYITLAGRGYLQVGNDEIYEQFQSGFSGAEYVEDSEERRISNAVMITLTGRDALTDHAIRRKKNTSGKEKTQLEAVVEYLAMLADEYHYDKRMLLWLPVLPKVLYLEQLEKNEESAYQNGGWKAHPGKWILKAAIGLYDDPENQAQEPLFLSFSEGGHIAVCGTVATGKSTLLQTFLYALIHQYSPQELNFYVLDYSSRMLMPYEDAPHCGGVMVDTDTDKAKKFFYMIQTIMEERKERFRGGNYSQYIQAQKEKEEKEQELLPAILVVIDNYSNFREKTENKYDDILLRISREGVGYGIFLVITSAGFGANEIPARVGDNIRTVLSLEMGDKFKYAEVLRTTRVEILPEEDVKGRGLAYVHGTILEFQTALAVEAEDAYRMSEKIRRRCKEMKGNWHLPLARRVPVIPEHPVFSEFCKEEEYQKAILDRRRLPIGYAAWDASVYSIDLWNTYCYFIQGRNHSGKKNVLKMLLYAAAKKKDAKVCLIDAKGQEWKEIAEQLGISYVGEKEIYPFFQQTVPVFKERNEKKRKLLAQGMEPNELAERMNDETQYFIFLSDTAAFLRSIYQVKQGAGSIFSYLENITEKGKDHGFFFIGILNTEQSSTVTSYTAYQNMASYKTGIHLGGNLSTQRLFQFSNIPFMEQSKSTKPGTGLTPNAEEPGLADTIVLPFVKGALP